jgi:hypothetical protein
MPDENTLKAALYCRVGSDTQLTSADSGKTALYCRSATKDMEAITGQKNSYFNSRRKTDTQVRYATLTTAKVA